MSDKLKEVCAYVRVSTDKQEELSPDSQIRLIKDYAAEHGMLLTHIYREEHGISGKDADKRPAFQEMIAACKLKEHPYDAILLWKFSRFARNIDESTYYKSVLRKKCGVDVISISEPIIEGMYGRLIEMVIEWSDEFYLYNLSGEVMRGMTQNALSGGYNSSAPIGYVKKKGEIPVVDPASASIVRKIFDMYVNGHRTKSDIASILNQSGIRTRRGGRWENRTISYVLENPFYIGKIRWNYYDRQNNCRKSSEDVILADGQHEPIISEELWAKAQTRMASERTRNSYGKARNVAATRHWLSGMVKCSCCGGSLAYVKPTSRYHARFVCWKRGKGLCESGGSITVDNLEKEIIEIIRDLSTRTKFLEYSGKTQPQSDDTDLIRKELASLDAKEKRIRDAYINGIDTIEEYRQNKNMLKSRKKKLEEQLNAQKKITTIPKKQNVIDLSAMIPLLSDPDADYIEKGNSLREIFDHFIFDKETASLTAVLNEALIAVKDA